jgi:hypothetical protein
MCTLTGYIKALFERSMTATGIPKAQRAFFPNLKGVLNIRSNASTVTSDSARPVGDSKKPL